MFHNRISGAFLSLALALMQSQIVFAQEGHVSDSTEAGRDHTSDDSDAARTECHSQQIAQALSTLRLTRENVLSAVSYYNGAPDQVSALHELFQSVASSGDVEDQTKLHDLILSAASGTAPSQSPRDLAHEIESRSERGQAPGANEGWNPFNSGTCLPRSTRFNLG